VDVLFYGLVSFVFKKDGTVRSVFLSPDGEPHTPLFTVNTGYVHELNASLPDLVATGGGDTGLAAWRFTEVTIDPSQFDDKSLAYDMGDLDLMNPGYDTKLRWVPSMDDIFGSAKDVDQAAIDKAAARGTWPVGTITPVFDREEHRTEKWTIGKRENTALADGIRLRFKLGDEALPAVFTLTRDGKKETVKVKGGGTIVFTDYPTRIPTSADDLKHFPHFYMLLKNVTTPAEPKSSGPTTPYPARCAPSLEYPPVP